MTKDELEKGVSFWVDEADKFNTENKRLESRIEKLRAALEEIDIGKGLHTDVYCSAAETRRTLGDCNSCMAKQALEDDDDL